MKQSLQGLLGALTVALSLNAGAGEVLKFEKGDVDLRGLQSVFAANEQDEQIWIVQFKSAITPADHKALKAAGAKVYRYIPEDALVVRGSRQAMKARLASDIQGFMPFSGEFKLSSALPAFSVFSSQKRDIFTLTLVHNDEVKSALEQIQKLDPQMKVVQKSGRFVDVVMNAARVPALSRVNAVEFVEPRAEIVPLAMPMGEDVGTLAPGDYSDYTGYETGTKVMNFESAWQAGFKGEGQIVSVADTGLDLGEINRVSGEFQGAILKGYAVGVGAKTWEDPMGHGTHVAGSVAGRGTASGGKFQGGAPKAMLIPEGMWSPIIDNLTVPPKLSQLFQPAFNDGARLHTNSWGKAADFGAYDSMAVQADEFLFNNPAMLVLFAAGNSGVDKDANGVIDRNSIGTPGTAKNVLTVGASENLNALGGIQKQIKDLGSAKANWPAEPIWSSKLSDNPKGIAAFSSRGPTRDGRLKPEIVAPGTNILSAFSQVPGANQLWGKYNDHYAYSGGTSMATPLAAGAAAVAREVLIKKHGLVDPSGAMVKVLLMHTAVDLYPGQYGEGSPTQELTHRPNNDQGYGRADLANVLNVGAGTQLIDNKTGVGTGEKVEIAFNVVKGQNLLANLAYFDAPGTPSAASALVNNLDMTLLTPDGQEIGTRDNKNNHEILEMANLPAGRYTLVITGTNVPMGKGGKQPYALALTVK